MNHTHNTKMKISNKMSLDKHPRSRKVIDKNGTIWGCLKSLSIELNIDKNNLSNMMNGKKKMTKRIKDLELKYLD